MRRRQSEETTPILLKISRWFATFSSHVLLYTLIVNFVFGYSINFFPYEEGYYIQPIKCKEGYKIYSLQYKEDEDISSWEENLEYWGYIKNA